MSETTPSTQELDDLIQLFFADADSLGRFKEVVASNCPANYRSMLAHESHMTVTVERRHGCEVDVQVLDSCKDEHHYCRKILLHRKSDQRVVQFGIVRLALSALEAGARDEILAQKRPLGRVLIDHDVLRHVQLNAVWQVECGNELADIFGVEPGHLTFGRTALIYTNGEPGVELLEIIAPEDTFEPPPA